MKPDLTSSNAPTTAIRLLAHEAIIGETSDVRIAAAVRVCEKLRRPLSTLAGATGFHALLSRALTLARAHDPELAGARVESGGVLEGFSEPPENEGAPQGLALIAELLELLHAFIGQGLTLRLLADVWPDLPELKAESMERAENDPTK